MKKSLVNFCGVCIIAACSSHPKTAQDFLNQAKNDKDIQQVISDFKSAIQIDSTALSYFCRGEFLLGRKKFPEAIADFDSAIRRKPDYAEAYEDRAVAKIDGNIFVNNDTAWA